jgi:hypothetical protein
LLNEANLDKNFEKKSLHLKDKLIDSNMKIKTNHMQTPIFKFQIKIVILY